MKADIVDKIKEEVQKQLDTGFLEVVDYLEWIANVDPIAKKNGKIRVDVDYRDLNKASPKNSFTLPHIDVLVDHAAGHQLLPFMDGFSERRSNISTSCHNDSSRYDTQGSRSLCRRYDCKTKDREGHIQNLNKFLQCIRKFQLWLNPKKCTFGVTAGKMLGFLITQRGIEVDPSKIEEITAMPPPQSEKEVKNERFVWDDACQNAFEKIKGYLKDPPILMPPRPGVPLILYLTVTENAMSSLLAQENEEKMEVAVYYISKRMTGYKLNYSPVEKNMLCIDQPQASQIMEEVHAGTCGPHMNGSALAKRILRFGYYWQDME
ncbi:uncharacterized protein LOC124930244 [Impatiens glandulifera]|uniref:uncharacterized protein LOC124930244 n=1 Tax=Impatiens glandulifera TaxID=253017 RepID=UPI001FB17563|nr:uncharacterized protein LOC124930244 [Impatiens glandulifera]